MKASQAFLLALVAGIPATALADSESAATRCTGTIVSACGLQIVKSVCTAGGKTDDDADEQYEHHGSDDGHSQRTQSPDIDESDGKNTYRKDDSVPPSAYPGHQQNYDYDYTDPHGDTHHVDWHERMGTSPDGKITICHRMGGARVTLDVPDDQFDGIRAHGHGDHEMDTLGRCEEQEDGAGHDDPVKIAAAVKLGVNPQVTSSVAGCLAAPSGENVSVTLLNGTTWTGPAPGCNTAGVSCSVPDNGIPNRGAVRSLH